MSTIHSQNDGSKACGVDLSECEDIPELLLSWGYRGGRGFGVQKPFGE